MQPISSSALKQETQVKKQKKKKKKKKWK